MTVQHPTQPGWLPQQPPTPPNPTPPPPKRHSRRNAIILAAAAAVLGLIALGRAVEPTADPAPATRAVQSTDAPTPTDPPATSPPEPTYATPKASDIKLTVKVLEKTNFGSAGSNITYRIEADWPGTYDPDKVYEVVYEVRGGEDGSQINTLEIEGSEYRVESEEFISTPSVGSRLTAKATSVEEA